MYSGHTCSFMLFGWMTTRHLRGTLVHWGWRPGRCTITLLHMAVWAVCLFAVLTLLLTRSHYTVDVVVAMAISSALFLLFHCWLVIEGRLAPQERTGLLMWLEGPDLALEGAVFTGRACSESCDTCGQGGVGQRVRGAGYISATEPGASERCDGTAALASAGTTRISHDGRTVELAAVRTAAAVDDGALLASRTA